MLRTLARLTRCVLPAVCCAGLALTLHAQGQAPAPEPPSPDAEPKFEVTSVKKSGPTPQMGMMFGLRPNGRFAMEMPVGALITLAYGIHRFQLIGGPAWLNTDRFTINAVEEDLPIPPTVPGTPTRMQLLVRSLLQERFALVIHNETRELPLSYLVLAREDRKLGDRLRPSTVDCRAYLAERAKAAKEGAPPTPPVPSKPGEILPCTLMGGFGRITAGSAQMSNVASMLGNMLGRPIYDRTNLTGSFDIQLEYTPDQMPQLPPGATLPPGLTMPSPDGPSLSTALQEQLGLKLENARPCRRDRHRLGVATRARLIPAINGDCGGTARHGEAVKRSTNGAPCR
ncbi:MAG TPA: TIGR03435 family protein [Vicinamibacterales bacterium]|nr:TIGR03435 family protein [Vicinamibacterales bacterium]